MTERLNLVTGKPNSIKYDKFTLNSPSRPIELIKTCCYRQPRVNVASYTRFVLPFAFQLQKSTQNINARDLFYTPNDKTDLSYIKRKKYFTRETADTLYDRGQWLSMCDNWAKTTWGKAQITIKLKEQAFKIGMLPPQLILFELPSIQEQQNSSLLQTGFLYVDVYFPGQEHTPQLDDLLILNEFFRYFGIPYDFHATLFKDKFANIPVHADQERKIASLGSLECYFERWANMLEIPLKYNNQYFQLFPKSWGKAARGWMYNKAESHAAEHWQIYADNRCYVCTAAFLKDGSQALKAEFEPNKTMLSSTDSGHWIKLLNVDNPPFDFNNYKYKPAQNTHSEISPFEREWIKPRTYQRWEHEGTWHGCCYHSTALLAPPSYNIFAPSMTYYFDTTALLLYIRMTLFRFGRELSKAIQDQDTKQEKSTRTRLQQLRRHFSTFTVLYRFPALSNQQQSIEMYEINRKFLDIDQFFDEIQQEIASTHEFLELIESAQQTEDATKLAKSANWLTKIGIPLAAGGLTTAVFSMTNFNIINCTFGKNDCSVNFDLLFQSFVVVVVGLITYFVMRKK